MSPSPATPTNALLPHLSPAPQSTLHTHHGSSQQARTGMTGCRAPPGRAPGYHWREVGSAPLAGTGSCPLACRSPGCSRNSTAAWTRRRRTRSSRAMGVTTQRAMPRRQAWCRERAGAQGLEWVRVPGWRTRPGQWASEAGAHTWQGERESRVRAWGAGQGQGQGQGRLTRAYLLPQDAGHRRVCVARAAGHVAVPTEQPRVLDVNLHAPRPVARNRLQTEAAVPARQAT
jgi:hypothetical protein